MSEELATYIAEYVNEEYRKEYHNHRTGPFPSITRKMVLDAIKSYELLCGDVMDSIELQDQKQQMLKFSPQEVIEDE